MEWIKIEDKMPDPKTLVLISNHEYLDITKPRYITIGQYEEESDQWYDEQWQDLFEPDYWMPLPEPPKD